MGGTSQGISGVHWKRCIAGQESPSGRHRPLKWLLMAKNAKVDNVDLKFCLQCDKLTKLLKWHLRPPGHKRLPHNKLYRGHSQCFCIVICHTSFFIMFDNKVVFRLSWEKVAVLHLRVIIKCLYRETTLGDC